MGLLNFLKGVWSRVFPTKLRSIKNALNIDIALTDEMLKSIDVWQNSYSGRALWLDEYHVVSLRLEKSIVREFSNVSLSEMTSSVSYKPLDEIYKKAIRNINTHFQRGLATGAMIIKPLGGSKVQFVSANAFIPVEYDTDGRLIKVIFPEFKKLGNKFYTRLEYHDLDKDKGLTITNSAYVSDSESTLGNKIPLSSIEEWVDLEESITYPTMNKTAFGYYRNPIDNDIDGSMTPISIFDSALPIIQKADIQFGRLDWEFESGERAIHIDESALKGNRVAKLNKRLYRSVDLDDNEGILQDYSPTIRQVDIKAGLEAYKREIEFSVGLAYGDLSDPATVAKTATEIKSAKDRKYNTVNAIQENLKDCMEDLVYALAFYNSMTTSGYKFVCDFKDSIKTDEETERKQDIQDLNLGILRPEEYRAKWMGEDIDTALQNLPQKAEVIE